MSIWIRNTTT